MYKVYCDGLPLLDLNQKDLVLIDPSVSLKDNDSGQFSFKISSKHPHYDDIKKLKSVITVFRDDEEIFCGRVTEENGDFYKTKSYVCKGELDYFTDSIQRPAEYHNLTVRGFLQTLIEVHNAQVDQTKQFGIGEVTVVDSNDSLYRYTNYEDTLTCIKEKLIKKLGGHIRIRKVNGEKLIDYIADYPNTNEQVIRFGKNLLDFSTTIDATDIATAIIPLGGKLKTATIPALDERLTIKSVNSGSDFIYSQDAVNNYGWIFRVVTFDDVNTAINLKRKGTAYLNNVQYENLVLNVTAVDLNNLDVNIERIKLLDSIRVVSPPHGLDRYFPVSELKLKLMQPENDEVTLGSEASDSSFTSSSVKTDTDVMERINAVPSERVILQEAIDNATALINSATHGYVVTTANEQLIMDTDDVETAQKVWRWNLNGFGYSNTGYNGTYVPAITMDGQIVGERLVGGSVSAEKLDVAYKTSVEQAIELAESNANDATDAKLTSYYTKVQVTTAIKNSADSVLISAKQEAVEYTDNRLKNYSTSAEIKVKTDAIESTVSKKLNTSDFTTKLTQSYSYVRIAWNNCSKYIQFEGSALNIYDSSDYKLMSLTYSGQWYYRDGITVGKIGTNTLSGYDTFRGLTFDLEYSAGYMCWAAKDSSGASSYTAKLIYYHKTTTGSLVGLHFGCKTFADGNLYLTDSNKFLKWSSGGCGFNGLMSWVNSSNSTAVEINPGSKTFNIYKGVTINFYADLDMHGWSIKNQSDARMKKNIQPTQVKALELLNSIDLKQFNWVQNDEFEPIGIIAQQLQLFAPELVETESDGHLSIKTTKFIFYLIKAIQELSGEGYEKVEWSDPYTLLEKKTFCNGLDKSNKTTVEDAVAPIKIPIRK